MKLIIGGAYQGKLAYAQKRYEMEHGWIDGAVCDLKEIENCGGIFYFHEYVKRLLPLWEGKIQLNSIEQLAETFAEELVSKNPRIVIVSNELGYGIVPIEKSDRLWREVTGRICTSLAMRADEVIRVVCGVGVQLKTKDS